MVFLLIEFVIKDKRQKRFASWTIEYYILCVLLGIQTCTQHNDLETKKAEERELLISQDQHAVNEQDEEGMIWNL